MAKFNSVGAFITGIVVAVITAWYTVVNKSRDSADSIYIWSVVAGAIGVVAGGFAVGSFEKYKPIKHDDKDKRKKR